MTLTTDRPPLADRIRAMLTAAPSIRELKMFGGLSFMVNEKMVVSVLGHGGLLVRTDPERTRELVALQGARPAEMGAGRSMGRAGYVSPRRRSRPQMGFPSGSE